jgi:hypothetical protein
MHEHYHQNAQLRRLHEAKKPARPATPKLGLEVVNFFKHSVQKRQTKFGRIAHCWQTLIPEALQAHCSLESLHKGSLTVIVDSSSHLYELKQLLLDGLEAQLKLACSSAGLRKISLKPGRWYEGEPNGSQRIRF